MVSKTPNDFKSEEEFKIQYIVLLKFKIWKIEITLYKAIFEEYKSIIERYNHFNSIFNQYI